MNSVRRSRLVPLLAAGLATALALAGCGGGDNDDSDDQPSESPTMVDGVTVPGLDLDFGDKAVFDWEPSVGVEGTVEVTVTGAEVAPMEDFSGYQLTDELLASTPYYVSATVTNTGESDLAGAVLPIYLDNDGETLYPSVEIPHFDKCAPRSLPEEFGNGESTDLCLIFFAPEGTELRSIALWPDGEQEQIDWIGEVSDPTAEDEPEPEDEPEDEESEEPDAD